MHSLLDVCDSYGDAQWVIRRKNWFLKTVEYFEAQNLWSIQKKSPLGQLRRPMRCNKKYFKVLIGKNMKKNR